MKKTESRKAYVTKKFLSSNGLPTQNAVVMFLIYHKYLPEGWNPSKIYYPAVKKIREYFGWNQNSGFTTMIMWGISTDCAKSKTSQQRYEAMSKANQAAKGLIGMGVVLSYVTLEA